MIVFDKTGGYLRRCLWHLSATRSKMRTHLVETATGLVLLIVLIFALSSAVRVGGGVSRTLEAPSYVVRLEIVDAAGNQDVFDQFVSRLGGYENQDLEIEVTSAYDSDIRTAPATILVSRVENLEATRLLASKLGLDSDQVVFKALENNDLNVTATLILGRDGSDIDLTGFSERENLD